MRKRIECAWCLHPSVDQYGRSPFDQMGQSQRWPTVFMHDLCATQFTRALKDTLDLSVDDSIVKEFYSAHDHSRF